MTATLLAAASGHAQGEPAPPPAAPPAAEAPPPRAVTLDQNTPAPSPAPLPPGPAQAPPPGYGAPPGYAQRPAPPPAYPPLGRAPGPRVITNWEPGEPIPPGYRPDTRVRKGLVIGGAVTLGAAWIVTMLGALTAMAVEEVDESISRTTGVRDPVGPDDYTPLFIPVAGPFITIGTAQSSGAGTGLLVIDGVVQSGGLAMLIIGLAAQKDVLVRTDVGALKDLQVAPQLGDGRQGFGLSGRF